MDEKDIKQKDYTFENQKIVSVQMEKEVRQSFIEYAMSVIVSRRCRTYGTDSSLFTVGFFTPCMRII